ncbi:NAD(P)H-binding protein [Streptomyces sp. NPDC002701]|uniref:NAD(P)H-binding protein n=1 Tax=Streptomyces sp. NPDC002701 TaxID=3364661 RepID=UPI00368DEC77
MILVTGATGAIGREVVRRLPADRAVRILARDPSLVTGAPATAEIVAGDYRDPQSLGRAMDGVIRAFLVTSRIGGDDDARLVRSARAAGVRHLVKLSAAAVRDSGADDLITRWQRGNEDLLRDCGLEWTLVRPRSFMSNTLSWAASLRGKQVVRALYGASPNACVDPRDVAEVVVRVLTEDGHAGRVHTLTGPEPISAVEQTDQLGRLLGRPLRFEEIGPGEARAQLAQRQPPDVVEALLASAERQRAGAKAQVESTVLELTGRPARPFRTWAGDHLEAFAAAPEQEGGR